MTQLKVRKALKFGWLGAIIALLLTLFWPVTEPLQVAINTAAGYAIAFAIRIVRGLFEKSK